MKTASVTDFRKNVNVHLKRIEQDKDILILSRPRKKGFVVLNIEEYESLQETAYLLSTPANAQRIMLGIQQINGDNLLIKDL